MIERIEVVEEKLSVLVIIIGLSAVSQLSSRGFLTAGAALHFGSRNNLL